MSRRWLLLAFVPAILFAASCVQSPTPHDGVPAQEVLGTPETSIVSVIIADSVYTTVTTDTIFRYTYCDDLALDTLFTDTVPSHSSILYVVTG